MPVSGGAEERRKEGEVSSSSSVSFFILLNDQIENLRAKSCLRAFTTDSRVVLVISERSLAADMLLEEQTHRR